MKQRPETLRFTTLCALAGWMLCAAPAAKCQTVRSRPPISAGQSGRIAPAGPATLADVFDKISWDTESRGTILAVSPEETTVPRPAFSFVGGQPVIPPPIAPLEPDASGAYRINQVVEHFDRRLVALHSLTVIAPTTMSVLNYSHLPKPDAYAGLDMSAKARLLFSSFTPAQWQAIASPNGIGAGDFKREQRDLYLSMLPDPFIVNKYAQEADGEGHYHFTSGGSGPITLSAEQREGIRLSLSKAMTWSFLQGANGTMGFGSEVQTGGEKLRVQPSFARFGPQDSAYGAVLREAIPNRSKPSQLPYDWSALDVSISFENVKTVGDLIRTIAAKTHSELFCDPRYADRPIAVRGSSAQAGDILHALAWAVTGTWRRLGDTFVLTDDLVGLGVRHAAIGNWVQENQLLGQIRDAAATEAITASHAGSLLRWPAGDPAAPGAALAEKIDAFQTTPITAPGPHRLLVPFADLPQAVQQTARQQAENYENQPAPDFPNAPPHQALRLDSLQIDEQVKFSYIIPDLGSADAQDLAMAGFGRELLGQPGRPQFAGSTARRQPSAAETPKLELPTSTAVRAVVIAPTSAADVEVAAREAHKHGFTEIWLQISRDQSQLLESAARIASVEGLAVRPVVRLLHAEASDKPEAIDRNILGESISEHAAWWKLQIKALKLPDRGDAEKASPQRSFYGGYAVAWSNSTAVGNLLREGDYLRCDSPDEQAEIGREVTRLVTIPGVVGVVFRNTSAQGYEAQAGQTVFYSSDGANLSGDPLLKLGYNDQSRLAFLRKYGVDPIDLSPLPQGDQLSTGGFLGMFTSLQLPFFRDLGGSGAFSTFNGRSGLTLGAKDSLSKWNAFRADMNSAFLNQLVETLRKQAPNLSIFVRRQPSPFGDYSTYFGSFEQPGTVAAGGGAAEVKSDKVTPPAPGAPRTVVRQNGNVSVREKAAAASKISYFAITYPSTGSDSAAMKSQYLNMIPFMLKSATAWEGVVLDMSTAPIADAIDILGRFSPPESSFPKP